MKRPPLPAILSSVILLLALFAVFLGVREFGHQTVFALDRRESIAKLGALLVHEKFDGIVDIGVSLASRPLVYRNIEKGDWNEALKVMEGVPRAFPFIDGVALFDTEGHLKAVAPSMPELIGKDFSHRDYFRGVIKGWKPYVSEAYKRAAEPMYPVVSTAVPIQSSSGKVLGILLLTIKLDTIVDWTGHVDVGSGGFIFVVDRKGRLVSNNSANPEDDLADYSSLPEIQEVLRGKHGVVVHEADPIVSERHVAAYAFVEEYGLGVMAVQPARIAFARRQRQAIEYTLFWLAIIFGSTFFLYRILKDREMIKDQRDREKVFLGSVGDGIVAIDRDWHIILWNKAASMITGWSEAEAIGRPFREVVRFIREHDRKEDVTAIEKAIIMKEHFSLEDNTLLVRRDGSEIAVGDCVAPIINQYGEANGVIIVFRDISEERESKHLRSDFVYATHQLRTPVTEAIWNLETAMDEEVPDKKRESLRIAHQSLLSVKKLSEDIVVASEIDQGKIAVKSSSIRLVEILSETENKFGELARAREVVLVIAPVSPLMAISTDKKILGRVLSEVIENAIQYSRRGGVVNVTATPREQEKALLIEVTDRGVGIPEEEQVLIFTKFFRGSNRGKDNIGDGLGLYIAKAYLALLGGKIWFESVEGEGTTFYLLLPIV